MMTLFPVMTFLLLIEFFSACVTDRTIFLKNRIAPPAAEIFERFLRESRLRGLNLDSHNITIEIKDFDAESTEVNGKRLFTVGQCEYGTPWSAPAIILQKHYWEDYSEDTREELLFHELGHCLLMRDHVETTFKDASDLEAPTSIMFSRVIPGAIYVTNRNYYINELFTNAHPSVKMKYLQLKATSK